MRLVVRWSRRAPTARSSRATCTLTADCDRSSASAARENPPCRTSTGRAQASALFEVAAARDARLAETGVYLPLVADGGIGAPAEMVVALALGADTLMLGNLLARTSESPGRLLRGPNGAWLKEYWMEGTLRARNHRRYAQLEAAFFEEGVAGAVPHAGSIHEALPAWTRMLRSALATAGCRDLAELHRSAVLERQSPAALEASRVRGVLPVRDETLPIDGTRASRIASPRSRLEDEAAGRGERTWGDASTAGWH